MKESNTSNITNIENKENKEIQVFKKTCNTKIIINQDERVIFYLRIAVYRLRRK